MLENFEQLSKSKLKKHMSKILPKTNNEIN